MNESSSIQINDLVQIGDHGGCMALKVGKVIAIEKIKTNKTAYMVDFGYDGGPISYPKDSIRKIKSPWGRFRLHNGPFKTW